MSESLEQQINQRMKDAMRAKDKSTVNLMRMIKSRVTEQKTSKAYKGEVGDALWLKVIEGYVKMSQKLVSDYEQLGAKGEEHAANTRWEVEALTCYLPSKADEETTRLWVEEAIVALGGPESAKMGAVMGMVMKAHKGEVEPALVKTLVNASLN